jgi:SAM-dependent methyltransferase
MKYYYHEHVAGYERMLAEGKRSWGEVLGHPDDFENFSSRSFLEEILPRLAFETENPRALELGSGTGPGACFLAQRGFRVDGIELIPAAVKVARDIAEERHLDIHYEVMDVTEIPHIGIKYDLIVDSYCLQGIVLESDRRKVFAAVRARLRPSGYYLISTAMYAEHRHHPESRVVDRKSGKKRTIDKGNDMIDPGLEGQTVLFTGANNPFGIGAGTARAFTAQGAKVLLTYLREAPEMYGVSEKEAKDA